MFLSFLFHPTHWTFSFLLPVLLLISPFNDSTESHTFPHTFLYIPPLHPFKKQLHVSADAIVTAWKVPQVEQVGIIRQTLEQTSATSHFHLCHSSFQVWKRPFISLNSSVRTSSTRQSVDTMWAKYRARSHNSSKDTERGGSSLCVGVICISGFGHVAWITTTQ